MPIKLNTASGGGVILTGANTASDKTITVPAVDGTMNTSAAANEVPAGSASAPSIYPTGDTNTGIFFPAADVTAIATGGSERARITSGGDFLVGKTTAAVTGDGHWLAPLGYSYHTIAAGANTLHVYSSTASAYRFYVTAAGVINATTTTITAISDQRLKENIRDLDDGLEKVMALQPRKFDWKEGKGEDTKNARGFIAQELETVFPDMVTEWIDPAPEGEEPYKAVNANLIPTLVKAIQELNAKVEAQAAEIAALKGNA